MLAGFIFIRFEMVTLLCKLANFKVCAIRTYVWFFLLFFLIYFFRSQSSLENCSKCEYSDTII